MVSELLLLMHHFMHELFSSNIGGPQVESPMKMTLVSARDATGNVNFTLSFNVSFGPPSRVRCRVGNGAEAVQILFDDGRGGVGIVRKVIRSHFVSSAQPDITRVSVSVSAPRGARTYTCGLAVSRRTITMFMYKRIEIGGGSTTTNTISKA